MKHEDREAVFEIEIPPAFYDALREKVREAGAAAQPVKLAGEIRWQPGVIVGEQDLLLGQLKRLEPKAVLILKPDSARMVERNSGYEWKLQMGAGPSGKLRFVIVAKTRRPESIRGGGFVQQTGSGAALDINEVPVTVQVVATLEPLNAAVLGSFAPGSELPVNLGENSRVEIAVNGRFKRI
jgi:flagellar motor switch/type III secretory pathway protein FliN